jgi:uncharacterized membrane protein YozB (DUF420 family)
MSATATEATRQESRTLIIAVLGALGLMALWFVATAAWPYANYSHDVYSDYFWPRRWGLVPHVIGGVIALTTGLVQLWLGLTNRVGALHRALGKVYASAILVGSIGGYYLAITIPPQAFIYGAGMFGLCTAWIITTSMALLSIRRRNVVQHREWMLRSYTVTFAFVTFRLFVELMTVWHIASRQDAGTLMAWACWSVPLLIAEPLIQLRKVRAR